jgi:mutator protein MutT
MRLPAIDRLLLLVRRTALLNGRRSDPLVLAGALIQDANGRYLLLHRNTSTVQWWEVPGGKVEAGEGLWEAAKRELAEELNTSIEPIEELGTGEFDYDGRVLKYTWYVARITRGDPVVVETERFDEARYFTLDEAEGLSEPSPSLRKLLELHRQKLQLIATTRRFDLTPSPVGISER